MANTTQTLTNQQWAHYFEQEERAYYSKNSMCNYRVDIWHFVQYLAEKEQSVLEQTTEMLELYLTHLSQLTNEAGEPLYKQATINRNRASLVAFYNYIKTKGGVTHNPATDIKTVTIYRRGDSTTVEHLTLEEAKALLHEIREGNYPNRFSQVRDLALYHLMLNTGICMNEVATLTADQFDFKNHRLTIIDRDGKSRVVPFSPKLDQELHDYLVERAKLNVESPLFFISNRGAKISIQNSNAALKKYSEAIGLGRKISNIALRHTYAINLFRLGASVEQVTELLGNSTAHYTSMIYQNYIQPEGMTVAEQLDLAL